MEAILEQLVRSPKLRLYVDELTETLRVEQAARQRFRETLDEDVRAEFINGEVVEHMTARDSHSTTIRNIVRLLDTFVTLNRLGAVRQEQALTEFTRNDYAPDICFWHLSKAASFLPSTTVYPIPDMIIEVVSTSTERRDRGVKFEDYAAHGVAEYWIVDPEVKVIEQHFLAGQQYEAKGRFGTDVSIASRTINGFQIPVIAAFDEAANLDALWRMKPA